MSENDNSKKMGSISGILTPNYVRSVKMTHVKEEPRAAGKCAGRTSEESLTNCQECEHATPDDDITSLIHVVNQFDTEEEFIDVLSTDRRRPFARMTALLGYEEQRITLHDVCKGPISGVLEDLSDYVQPFIDCARADVMVYRGGSTIKAGDFIALDYYVAIREGSPVYCTRIPLEDVVWTGLHEAEWYYAPKELQEKYRDFDGSMFYREHKVIEEPEPEPEPEPVEEESLTNCQECEHSG